VRERTVALQQSESHLQAIIAAEPECIKIVDAQGLLTQMNPAGLAMIEADSLEQVLGRDVSALLAPEHMAAIAPLAARVMDEMSDSNCVCGTSCAWAVGARATMAIMISFFIVLQWMQLIGLTLLRLHCWKIDILEN
jgi:transcriptional regulator with PAS, ATPase and Fis domain